MEKSKGQERRKGCIISPLGLKSATGDGSKREEGGLQGSWANRATGKGDWVGDMYDRPMGR